MVPKCLYLPLHISWALRLQRQLASVIGGKEYGKWVLVVPPKVVEELGWREGETLEALVKGDWLILLREEPVIDTEKEPEEKKMNYEQFRERVLKNLADVPDGLTWTELKQRGGFYQTVPNNRWVGRLEDDIQLRREKVRARGVVWRVSTEDSSG